MAEIIYNNGLQIANNPPLGLINAFSIRAFGEDKLSRRSIRLGKMCVTLCYQRGMNKNLIMLTAQELM